MKRKALIFRTKDGKEPYSDYVDGLRDRMGAAKIRARVTRAELGNLGDWKSVGKGVLELRISFGPGYRIYIALHGKDILLLLCAGDKSHQTVDIRNAHLYWEQTRGNL